MTYLLVILVWLGTMVGIEAATIQVESVLLSAIEETDVATEDSGVISELDIHRGQLVEANQVLAKLADFEETLAYDRALIELEIAQEQGKNDVDIRHAKKAHAVSFAEARRAEIAFKKYPQSITESELERLRLTVERDKLAIEQNEFEHRIANANVRLMQNTVKMAELQIRRRSIVAPFAGIVAEVGHTRGEWVETGDLIVRLIRTDRLLAEGFIDAEHADQEMLGTQVSLQLEAKQESRFEGKIVFVSPELDPVNGQVLIAAEIDNRDFKLRPGSQATLTIKLK